MRRRKRDKRRKRQRKRPVNPQDRGEFDVPRDEYKWLNSINQKGGPDNPSGIPGDFRSLSERPDDVLAWIRINCKFASKLRP